jgi:hypothetical protein
MLAHRRPHHRSSPLPSSTSRRPNRFWYRWTIVISFHYPRRLLHRRSLLSSSDFLVVVVVVVLVLVLLSSWSSSIGARDGDQSIHWSTRWKRQKKWNLES